MKELIRKLLLAEINYKNIIIDDELSPGEIKKNPKKSPITKKDLLKELKRNTKDLPFKKQITDPTFLAKHFKFLIATDIAGTFNNYDSIPKNSDPRDLTIFFVPKIKTWKAFVDAFDVEDDPKKKNELRQLMRSIVRINITYERLAKKYKMTGRKLAIDSMDKMTKILKGLGIKEEKLSPPQVNKEKDKMIKALMKPEEQKDVTISLEKIKKDPEFKATIKTLKKMGVEIKKQDDYYISTNIEDNDSFNYIDVEDEDGDLVPQLRPKSDPLRKIKFTMYQGKFVKIKVGNIDAIFFTDPVVSPGGPKIKTGILGWGELAKSVIGLKKIK